MFFDAVKHIKYIDAKKELEEWINTCNENGVEEFKEASKTIENWLLYIVNSFIDERFSNGFTEGLNNKIKVIKRIGYGYRNFEFFRMRIMYILNSKLIGKVSKVKNRKSKK